MVHSVAFKDHSLIQLVHMCWIGSNGFWYSSHATYSGTD